MNKEQRKWLAEGLRELANLAIAGLVFGQVLSGNVKVWISLLGLSVGIVCYVVGIKLIIDTRRK